MKTLLAVLLPLTLAACASAPAKEAAKDPAKPAASTRVSDAATAPLTDLNLKRVDIPPVLIEARQNPYARPVPGDCAALINQVEALNAALGPDLDKPIVKSHASLTERGSDEAEDAAFDALRQTAEGAVPFRGWVRKLSGAESYAKSVTAALVAGNVRRAYLKGLGQAQGCAAPARPLEPALSTALKP